MTEPTNEHIKEYIEQKAEGRLGAFESSLYDELVENGEMTEDDFHDYMDKLKAASRKTKAKTEEGRMLQSGPAATEATILMDNINRLNRYFRYGRKKITKELLSGSPKKSLIAVTQEGITNVQEVSNLLDSIRKADNTLKTQNFKAVLNASSKEPISTTRKTKRKTFDIKDFFGSPNLKSIEARGKIYAYWAEVEEYYAPMLTAAKKFTKSAEKQAKEEGWDEELMKFNASIESLKPYVMKFLEKEYIFDDHEERVWALMNGIMKIAGEREKKGLSATGKEERSRSAKEKRERRVAEETSIAEGYATYAVDETEDEDSEYGDESGEGAAEARIAEEQSQLAVEEQAVGAEDSAGRAERLKDWEGGGGGQYGEMADPKANIDLEENNKLTLKNKPVMVDPLFYYYFQTEGLDEVPISKGEAKKIFADMRRYGRVAQFPQKMLNNMDKYIDKLEEELSGALVEDEYYLPVSKFLIKGSTAENKKDKIDVVDWDGEITKPTRTTYTHDELSKVDGVTADFLVRFAKLIEEVETSFGHIGVAHQEGKRRDRQLGANADRISSQLHQGLFARTPSEIMGGEPRKLKESKKHMENLIKAVNKYYLDPINTKNWVDDKPRWMTDIGSAKAAMKVIRLYSGKEGSDEERKWLDEGLGVDYTEINTLKNFIKRLVGAVITYDASLVNMGEDVVEIGKDMFGDKTEKLMKIWVGAALHRVANGLGLNVEEERFEGKTLKFWQEQFLNKERPYPMMRLGDWLNEKGGYFEDEPKMKRALEELQNVIESANPVRKSLDFALLEAHDMVRIMKGEDIIFGRCSVNNPDDMDYLINKIYTENNTDVAASEISDIMLKTDAYKNIANEHGLTENVIYTIKAMCR